jgi:predicted transcriptional regulator
MKTSISFWASKVLLTAVRFQIFTLLAQKGAMSGNEIKSQLGLQCTSRYAYDFLDAQTSMRQRCHSL